MAILHVVLDNVTTPKKIEMSGSTTFNHLIYLIGALYTACVDNHPYITSTGATNYPCLLSCGVLSATTGVVGDYLIWWCLNSTSGDVVLVSGNVGNPDATVTHPFSAQPVPGGTLYPVIRYIWIDGFKYTSYVETGSRYSPDLINCLTPITILDMTCNNGSNPILSYSHGINYNYTASNTGSSTRTITFLLNTGGTTKYFAWEFRGYSVPDTMKITYSGSTSQVLSYWSVGSSVSSNYTVSPKVFGTIPIYYSGNNGLRSVCNLSGITYVSGDYLKIEMTPNPGNMNTNWDLYMKCLTGNTFNFDCTNFPVGYNIINTGSTPVLTVVTGTSSCYFNIVFNTLSAATFNNTQLNKYFSFVSINGSGTDTYNGNLYTGTDQTSVQINIGHYTGYTTGSFNNNNNCISANSGATFSKTGNTLKLVFTDIVDYEIYKNSYFTVTGSSDMINYSPIDTDVNHFKQIVLQVYNAQICGDNQTGSTVYFHYSSPVYFDNTGKTITIIATTSTNSVPAVSCNNLSANASYFVTTGISNDIYWPFIGTKIRATNPFYAQFINSSPSIYNASGGTFCFITAIPPSILNNVCALSDWFVHTGGTADGIDWINSYGESNKVKYKVRVRVDITNMSDPANNWKLYTLLDSNGYPSAPQLVYSIP